MTKRVSVRRTLFDQVETWRCTAVPAFLITSLQLRHAHLVNDFGQIQMRLRLRVQTQAAAGATGAEVARVQRETASYRHARVSQGRSLREETDVWDPPHSGEGRQPCDGGELCRRPQ